MLHQRVTPFDVGPQLYLQGFPEMMDINEIPEYLAHRYPFLLGERVVDPDVQGQRISAHQNVSIQQAVFQGDFPPASEHAGGW